MVERTIRTGHQFCVSRTHDILSPSTNAPWCRRSVSQLQLKHVRTAQDVQRYQGASQESAHGRTADAGKVPQRYVLTSMNPDLVALTDAIFQANWAGWRSSGVVRSLPSSRERSDERKNHCQTDTTNSYTGAPYFSAMASARLGIALFLL